MFNLFKNKQIIVGGSLQPRSQTRRRRVIKLVVAVLLAVILFFAGYQLAIYQVSEGDSLLPHFNIGCAPFQYSDVPTQSIICMSNPLECDYYHLASCGA